jgi:hypothetical protein
MFTLSDKRIVALAESSRNVGQVFLATMILEPMAVGHVNWSLFVTGVFLTAFSFYTGILFADYSRSAIINL